ncbi:MAG TPA: hypothetical protein VE262_12320 [Blastocatellia bacterium]|nr:hypothetical protein [Blastocatellia bacterium]
MSQQRWSRLEQESKDDEQKKSALKALLLQQCVNTKRSLLVSARYYRAAYLYRWLDEPTFNVSLGMGYNELQQQFDRMKLGIEQLLSSKPPAQPFDTGYYLIPVVKSGESKNGGAPASGCPYVVLDTSARTPTLSWGISIEEPPFKGSVPNGGAIGFFVEEGWFYLEGAEPNGGKSISLTVSTSGYYANAYGDDSSGRKYFVSSPLETDFIYSGEAGGGVDDPRTPWKPASTVKASYLTPTPFTQWTLAVKDAGSLANLKAIRMRLSGTYNRL